MNKSTRVLVSGPLAPYASGYEQHLANAGYASWTALSYRWSLARVSCWLAARGLAARDLDAECVETFLTEWRAGRTLSRRTPRGMNSVLAYLRGLDAIPSRNVRVPRDGLEDVVAEFMRFLVRDRGLAAGTVRWYGYVAELFLADRVPDHADLAQLTGAEITVFVLSQSRCRGAGSLSNVVTGLRVFLTFLYLRGYLPVSLAAATPSTVGWRDRGTWEELTPDQVTRLLSGCDRRTRIGRRDFAILTLLARLGLRCGEVAGLQVGDLDWRAGEITVHGKGNRTDRLPLPVDVGQAIADYCHRGRGQVASRSLFIHSRAPYDTMSAAAVSAVVVRACDGAGLPPVGAHRLRHAAASSMRRAGTPLLEISQVLRHSHTVTTAGYGHEDMQALASIARPWPGSVA